MTGFDIFGQTLIKSDIALILHNHLEYVKCFHVDFNYFARSKEDPIELIKVTIIKRKRQNNFKTR
jgi:hypothetical protein